MLMSENYCFTWSVTPSFGLYLLNLYHCKTLWTDLPVATLTHFINVLMQLPSTFWRHHSDGTGSSLPISQSLPLALWIKSWLTQPFLEYSLTTILDAWNVRMWNISMEHFHGMWECDFIRNGVSPLKMEDWRCLPEEVMTELRSEGQEPPRPTACLLIFAQSTSCTCRNAITLFCSLPQFYIYFPTEMLFLPGESFLSSPPSHLG